MISKGVLSMLKSMTGFGRCDVLLDGYHVQIQIKSVNHRYSDITIKAPRHCAFLEDKLKSLALSSIARGKVDILLSLEQEQADDKIITLEEATAEGYLNALRSLTRYGLTDDLTVSSLAQFHDIFHISYKEADEEKILQVVTHAFEQALTEFMAMRIQEGSNLESSLRQHLVALEQEIAFIEDFSPRCVDTYRDRLRAKLEEVLADTTIDENRILTEAAIFADKTAVDEETVRLRSHIKAFETALASEQPIGKKLDFIVQEMNRETNTIGSKANDLTLASHVVEMKSLIEKIREQIQNIE